MNQEYLKDLETIENIPPEEVKFIRTNTPENTMMDVRTYRISMEKDGGKSWEKLKRIRSMFNK